MPIDLRLLQKETIFNKLTMKVGEMLTVKPEVPQMLRNMFIDDVSAAASYAYEETLLDRGILTDDGEYSDGEFFDLNKSTEKAFAPPMFIKGVVYNGFDAYKVVAGQEATVPAANAKAFIDKVAETMQSVYDRYNRTLEVYASQAIQTGVVQLENKASIDFKMKASHKVAYHTDNNFADDTKDPANIFITGAKRLISNGMIDAGKPIPVLLGEQAHWSLINNKFIKDRADIKQFDFGQFYVGSGNSWTGAVPLGMCSFGSYKFVLLGYNAHYKNAGGTEVPFINPKGITMIGGDFMGKMFYAGLPRPSDLLLVASKFMLIDEIKYPTRKLRFFSRPCPILRMPDRIFNAQVLV